MDDWAENRSLRGAVPLAQSGTDSEQKQLTPRERQIADLVAQGLTN